MSQSSMDYVPKTFSVWKNDGGVIFEFLKTFLKEVKEEDCLISSGIVFHASIATGRKEDLYIFNLYTCIGIL